MPRAPLKFPITRTVPEIVRVFRRRIMSREVWRQLGRPDWVLVAIERSRAGRGGGVSTLERRVYYRTLRPAYLDLDVICHTSDWTVRMEAGATTDIGLHTTPCEVEAVKLVEPKEADARKGLYSKAIAQLWWRRGITPLTCQEYQIGE